MKIDKARIYSYIYFFLIALFIGLSTLYIQGMVSSIGSFPPFNKGFENIELPLIITSPILLTILFGLIMFYAYKTKLFKFNARNIIIIAGFLVMFLYMALIIFLKDATHAYNIAYQGVNDLPSLKEKLYSLFSFYLNLLAIFTLLKFLKPVKGYKEVTIVVLSVFILIAVAAIIYSLIFEIDKYANFDLVDDLYDKPYSNLIMSFFYIGNSFGHTVYNAILSIVVMGFLFRKDYIHLFTLIFFPFVFYSNCRASILSTIFLLFLTLLVCFVRSYKKNMVKFYILGAIFFLILGLLIIDIGYYPLVTYTLEDGSTTTLKAMLDDMVVSFEEDRLGIIYDVIKIDPLDRFSGFGFGPNYIVSRTYGYYYYVHNAIYEVLMIGGVPFFLFIGLIFAVMFYRFFLYRFKTRDSLYLSLFIILLITETIYGLFESHVTLIFDYQGMVLSILIIGLPKLFFEADINGNNENYIRM